MRVLHVAACYPPTWAYGGIPRAVHALVRAQRARGAHGGRVDAEVGRVKVVDFDDKSSLVRIGSAAWAAPRGLQTKPADPTVHQGALEQANTNSMDELVSMVVAQRHFENSTTVMRTIDQTYKRLNQPK